MSAEWAAVIVTLVGIAGTVINVLISLNIRSSINALKVWILEKFVTKEDLHSSFAPFSAVRGVMQLDESVRRKASGD